MIKKGFENSRENKQENITTDLVVIGGGLSGVCAAVVAARDNIKVVLVQDRPLLGGNASSEVRLWALGATSHMGNNNRWSREGGLINEMLLDNLKRNKEGNPLIFDTILLEKVLEEKNITLLLNTSVYETHKHSDKKIKSVVGFCSQNSTTYNLEAPLFCDASGDGIVAFQSGASFRMGTESPEEFNEGFAPNLEDYGNLLGHSLYFYTKDIGKPVSYTAPSFAIKNAKELPRIKNYQLNQHGCKLWWVEYGGRLDTILQSEDIKLELWKVIYGIWDYVKNSGEFPEAENLTLEWVGTIPGKRESRRFEGDFMLTQNDIVAQKDYYDRVTFGGWAMDLHPADGIYSKHSSCTQWHSKGVYSIPFRSFYSKDIDNLFLAGRIISASHVAFGSSRVMLTCAHGAQAVGKAASLCLKNGFTPRELAQKENIALLQLELNKDGQSIPRLNIEDKDDLVQKATIISSSEFVLNQMSESGDWQTLNFNTAQLLPLESTSTYSFTLNVKAQEDTMLEIKLKGSEKDYHFTPDAEFGVQTYSLKKGVQEITFTCEKPIEKKGYFYLSFMQNELVQIPLSNQRSSGIMTVQQKTNPEVSNFGMQNPPENIGIDAFEFWTPLRYPEGKNIALSVKPKIELFSVNNVKNNQLRPSPEGFVNAWVADLKDANATLNIEWKEAQKIDEIKLFFDADFDNSLESILMGHPESETPYVVSGYSIYDDNNNLIYEKTGNYQAINEIEFSEQIQANKLRLVFSQKHKNVPVSLFKISVM